MKVPFRHLLSAVFAALGLLVADAVYADLYVSSQNSGTIGEYTAGGTTVNASLISGLADPYGIAVSGSVRPRLRLQHDR